ncbi:MAG: hypothetical protein HFF84_00115 [Oscillibacter sp.]|nr:hypothetical protein [Oscillibacter sp.]
MEIQSTSRLQRNARQVRMDESASAQTAAKSNFQKKKEDCIALSKQVLTMLEEQSRRTREEQERKKMEAQKEGGSSELDALSEKLKKMAKCQRIAARIQAGDKVPPEDERYLMDHDAQSYQMALALRQPKRNPKKWDTLLEKEDYENGSTESIESADSADDGSDAPEASGTAEC